MTRSLLLIAHNQLTQQSVSEHLTAFGFQVLDQESVSTVNKRKETPAALLLAFSLEDLLTISREYRQRYSNLPLLWWSQAPLFDPEKLASLEIDGVLYPSLSALEVNWSLSLARSLRLKALHYINENEQLLIRLEDRKWIDQAKNILCELKRIPEVEAYEVLRKQAMNERKKIADVAKSIVTVFRLMRESTDPK